MDLAIELNATHPRTLIAFTDADWAGDKHGRKSTSGLFVYSLGPIYWRTSKQNCISLSSAEAEYVAMFEGSKMLQSVGNLLKEIGIDIKPIMKCDNRAPQQTVNLPSPTQIQQQQQQPRAAPMVNRHGNPR